MLTKLPIISNLLFLKLAKSWNIFIYNVQLKEEQRKQKKNNKNTNSNFRRNASSYQGKFQPTPKRN